MTLLTRSRNLVDMTRQFLHMEAAGGIILVIAAACALIIANSPWHDAYHNFFNEIYFSIGFSFGENSGAVLTKSVLLWINDGFMAIFFLLVGLEIKREILRGELSSRDRAILPLFGALGGIVLPALIYLFLTQSHPELKAGWAIPAATDIAFSLGVLALLGTRAPLSLKILLTAIAIIDDLAAILIIAFFYSGDLNYTAMMIAAAAAGGLLVLNLSHVTRIAAYILVGAVLWVALLKSGVHPTIGGVLTAFAIPLSCPRYPQRKPLESLEHGLHPWVIYMILPLFAFANAGVAMHGLGLHDLLHPVTVGIMGGLVIGKPVGIMVLLGCAMLLRICTKPDDLSWAHLFGMSFLCGIGFTMSLFIGELAFGGSEDLQMHIRLGVLGGSILSAALGYMVLRYFAPVNVSPKTS